MTNDPTTITTTDVDQTTSVFDVDSTIAALKELPNKRNGKDLKQKIASMALALRDAEARGYSMSDLSTWLKTRGLEIGPTTLRHHLQEASPKKKKRARAKTPKASPAPAASAAETSVGTVKPAPISAPTAQVTALSVPAASATQASIGTVQPAPTSASAVASSVPVHPVTQAAEAPATTG